MDVLLPAVASEFVGRLFTFLIRKYQERGATDNGGRLQRALVRARVIIEEAEGRQIVNRGMLQQLNQLRRELCRAAYALDAFRWRANDPNRRRILQSRSRSHTRPPLSSDTSDVLPVMVQSLEAALSDMREFVVLLSGCPRVTRQPYCAYLFMESCMFGRQMEKDEIIGFLLRPSQDLDVLPIIGPHEVGKRTLVEHVCLDERVRDRFTKVHRLCSDELDLHNCENHWSLFDFTARLLMVVNIVDDNTDVDEAWRRFHSAIRRHAHRGSKIIVISRTEAHSNLGTVPPLKLHAPRREELWYFFKALAFGPTDPEDRPDLVRIAMSLFKGMSNFAAFSAATIAASPLRADLSVHSWRHWQFQNRHLGKMYAKATVLQLDVASDWFHDCKKAGLPYLCQPVKDGSGVPCLLYNRCKLTNMAPSELPKVMMLDLVNGSSPPPAGETQFDVLVWQSRIPPYASYVARCDMEKARQLVVALKSNKRRRDHQEDGPGTLQGNALAPILGSAN